MTNIDDEIWHHKMLIKLLQDTHIKDENNRIDINEFIMDYTNEINILKRLQSKGIKSQGEIKYWLYRILWYFIES